MIMFHFLRLLRILRIAKLSKILAKFEQEWNFSPVLDGVFKLVKLSIVVVLLSHWCACFWYIVSHSDPIDNWVVFHGFADANIMEKYVAALYFATTTFMTVGYGDFAP